MEVSFFFKPFSQSECRDNKNAATFWRRRLPTKWECRISRYNKYHMKWSYTAPSQWVCSFSSHNKNHMLLKCDTMLTSITCYSYLSLQWGEGGISAHFCLLGRVCDLWFQVNLGQILNPEHLYIIEVPMHANMQIQQSCSKTIFSL